MPTKDWHNLLLLILFCTEEMKESDFSLLMSSLIDAKDMRDILLWKSCIYLLLMETKIKILSNRDDCLLIVLFSSDLL